MKSYASHPFSSNFSSESLQVRFYALAFSAFPIAIQCTPFARAHPGLVSLDSMRRMWVLSTGVLVGWSWIRKHRLARALLAVPATET